MSKNDDDQNVPDEQKDVDQKQTAGEQISSEEFEKLKMELDDVKNLAGQMEAQLKRAVADYHNLEKRVAEGKNEFSSWATAELIKHILPVMHNFDQVLAGAGDEERKSAWFKGVEMSVKQLQETLRSEGLDEIEADGHFDPALHEAVDTDEGEHDKILKVAQKGYTLNGKVLQPAKVVVGRKQ